MGCYWYNRGWETSKCRGQKWGVIGIIWIEGMSGVLSTKYIKI